MQMKISWGHSILFTYLAFAGGILFMVYLASRENRDLVSEHYYADELAYQSVIDQSANTAALSTAVTVEQSADKIVVNLPQELQGIQSSGKWILYFAADRQKDFTGDFETKTGSATIVVPQQAKGLYTLTLQWKSAGKPYYFEQNIFR
jgi:hypothetical protein